MILRYPKGSIYDLARVTVGVLIVLLLTAVLPKNSLAQSHEPPFILPPRSELNKLRSAILYTEKGKIYFELYPEEAPWHVANLKYLADKGFYRNLHFHLYSSGYYIQGGAPTANPNSGPGYVLPAEFNRHKNEAGALGMGRFRDLNPDRSSNGSQFYILLGDAPQMDGDYTVFGKLVAGREVLNKLEKGDRIDDFKVFVRPSGRGNSPENYSSGDSR